MAIIAYTNSADGNKKLSANFTVKDFACKDGSDFIKIDSDLVVLLQKIRDYFGKSVTINSGYRTAAHNKSIGGAASSKHLTGQAADIIISGVDNLTISKYAETGADMADVAMWNELGTVHSPPRPFLRQTVENNESGIVSAGAKLIESAIVGGGTAQDALESLGVLVKGFVQDTITSGSFAPNAESTVRQKRSSKPLIDTGQMRQSVNYVIKPKGDD